MSFVDEVNSRVGQNPKNASLKKSADDFMRESLKSGYSYNFSWLGVPIIQYPQDVLAIQEVIWKVKPDLIIECGVARGGSILFSASMLSLIGNGGKVVGVDIDIRDHARKAIADSKFADSITLIQGSSIEQSTIAQVHAIAKNYKNILVILDSNHTEDHVVKELEAYASLVSLSSYCMVFDSVVEFFPEETSVDRPWNKGDNPHTAIMKFLKTNKNFEIDPYFQNKTLITVAPDGFLRRI